MKLSNALGMIKRDEKTASVSAPASFSATAPSPNDAGDRLRQALKEATAPEASAKTAGHASPIEDLTKIAADLSQAEHEALVKEAQLYGASVCDGFMARAAQYNSAVASTKTASANTGDSDFEKFAAENPDLVKEAAEQGYAATAGQLEKLAEAAYAQGWNTTVAQIHKTACDAFVAGFQDTAALLEASR